MSVPGALKHNWNFDLELSTTNSSGEQCYRCSHCRMWSPSTMLDQDIICPAKNRRRAQRRKWADRRTAPDNMALIYALALSEIPCRS